MSELVMVLPVSECEYPNVLDYDVGEVSGKCYGHNTL